ncbi:shikimate kinase [Flavobacterium humi]|uniref:Shikimate kinase n=1 Tax=Flavobacterium humi TaxID=2562683 RepID=A0A4Z0L367_9FLAO|nr:shikimate kinase [Flavobacterium humi]TGD56670.1 shikimate kinase [Flavobacterium humi]
MNKIILVGYMGSGKTEIGKLVSKNAKIPFYDLDHLIENRLSKSINQIFSEHGEVFFRKKEHEIFTEMIHAEASFVLSLGGGTPCYANNHLLLQSEGVVSVYLKATIATLTERLSDNKSGRPLLKDLSEEELAEYIAKHLFDRSFYYNQCKHVVVVDGKTPSAIAEEVEAIYSKYA